MKYALKDKTIAEAVGAGKVLVVAKWEAKEGQAERVAGILHHFVPDAQKDPGACLFLVSRSTEKPEQFLFYELFGDEAALKQHQESDYLKKYVTDQALSLLAKRERSEYALL